MRAERVSVFAGVASTLPNTASLHRSKISEFDDQLQLVAHSFYVAAQRGDHVVTALV